MFVVLRPPNNVQYWQGMRPVVYESNLT